MKGRFADVRVHNPIIGELVPPELDFLINLLSQINSADAQLVIEHARKIYTAYQLSRGRPDNHGFKIKGKKRRRAEPVPATRGLKDDLQRLLKAARGGSAKEWQTAWLGVSGEARALVTPLKAPGSTKSKPPPVAARNERAMIGGRSGTFALRRYPLDTREMKLAKAGSFSSVIPNPKGSIPRIEAALAQGEFSSKRQTDKLTYIFVLRVRDAYLALTGKKGLTFHPHLGEGGLLDGGLLGLAEDIDRQLGTKVLTVSRLRKKEADMGLSAEELAKLRKPWGKRTS